MTIQIAGFFKKTFPGTGLFLNIIMLLNQGTVSVLALKDSEVYKSVLFTFQGYFEHDFCEPEQLAVKDSGYSEV